MLICKKCKNYIDDESLHCDTCRTFTSQYAENVENLLYEDGGELQLKPILQFLGRLTRMQLRRLEKSAKDTYQGDKYSEHITKQIKELAYTVEKVIKEGRALEREQKDRVNTMSLRDKMTFMKNWIKRLPPELQREFLTETFKITNEDKDKKVHPGEG